MAQQADSLTRTDRRRERRTSIRCLSHAVQKDPRSGEQVESMGVTEDISASGARLLTAAHFDRDREIDVAFAFGETIVEARGRIVHMEDKPDGQVDMGVEFQGLGEAGRRLIEDCCRCLKAAIGRKLRGAVAARPRGPVVLAAGRA